MGFISMILTHTEIKLFGNWLKNTPVRESMEGCVSRSEEYA